MKESRSIRQFFMTLSRLLVGAVFVFSSVAKGVDPLGTAYRIEDYFVAYGTTWANSLALGLAILLCAVEFTIGMSMFFTTLMKITSWLLLTMMIFFTFLTFYDAIYEPVADCGCFGDALKLTNWETFYKNIVLMFFVLIIFVNRNAFKNKLYVNVQAVIFVFFFVIFTLFTIYNYKYLPMIDFTPWKVGTQVLSDKNIESQTFVKYRNLETGIEKEFLSPDYPWSDSVWMSEWQFIDQRVVRDNDEPEPDLFIEDESGADFTRDILLANSIIVVTIPDIKEVDEEEMLKIIQFHDDLQIADCELSIVCGSLPEDIVDFAQLSNNQLDIYYADATVLKTMVRSNPGIILLHKGKLIKKWPMIDLPDTQEVVDLLNDLN